MTIKTGSKNDIVAKFQHYLFNYFIYYYLSAPINYCRNNKILVLIKGDQANYNLGKRTLGRSQISEGLREISEKREVKVETGK